jgi:hypothetical protein
MRSYSKDTSVAIVPRVILVNPNAMPHSRVLALSIGLEMKQF